MGESEEEGNRVTYFQSSITVRICSISRHIGFTGCIFQVAICPWQILKQYFMIPTSVGYFFLCNVFNYYLKRPRSHRKRDDSRIKPQGKDWRYCTFFEIVIFCILNKIQLVSFYHLLVSFIKFLS